MSCSTGDECPAGSFRFTAHHTFEPAEGGTRINLSGQAEVGGLFKLVGPLVVRLTKRQVEANYRNLKRLMEAGAL
jgi:carbon monoxide dehydrogenase subunit G